DHKHLAAIARGFGPDPALEDLHQMLRDGKPESEATILAGASAVNLVEPLEYSGPVLGRDAWSVVANSDQELVARLGADVDRGARRRKLGRVVQEVGQGLRQLGVVGLDSEARRDIDLYRAIDAEPRHAVRDQLVYIESRHFDR